MAAESNLSERELAILRLIATGATNQRIANELKISVNTVKVHVRNIFGKIGTSSRAEAVMYAVRNGIGEANEVATVAESAPSANLPIDSELALDGAISPQVDGAVDGGGQASVVVEMGLSEEPVAYRRARGWLPIAIAVVVVAVLLTVVVLTTPLAQSVVQGLGLAASPPATPIRAPSTIRSWRELASMPEGRASFALAAYSADGRRLLYAIGGEDGKSVRGDVLRYDPATNVWVQMTSKPTPVSDVHAAVVGGRIYVAGGRTRNGELTAVLEAYEPQRDRWLTLAPMPAPLAGSALAALEGKLYVFGGWDGHSYRGEVWQYNPDEDRWRERVPMTPARAHSAAVVLDQRIYLFGGDGDSGGLTLVQSYSPAEEDQGSAAWQTRAPIPSSASRGDAGALGSMAMLVGADDQGGRLLIYSVQTDSWRSASVPLGGVRDLRVQAVGDRLYIVGGMSDRGAEATAYEYQAFTSVFIPVVPQ